jgi:hypothetical protein
LCQSEVFVSGFYDFSKKFRWNSGGGLIAGIALAVKTLRPSVKIIVSQEQGKMLFFN